MKVPALFTTIAILTFALFAFTSGKSPEPLAVKTGSYGICTGNEADWELTLNADSTFRYRPDCNPSAAVTQGKWKAEKGSVVLYNYTPANSIPDKWKVDGNCLKGKQGLMWIRICHLQSCTK